MFFFFFPHPFYFVLVLSLLLLMVDYLHKLYHYTVLVCFNDTLTRIKDSIFNKLEKLVTITITCYTIYV